jgi:nucleotide-binding universal stress UspA family protein
VTSPLSHALLAYDGSPKAHEALFIAAYLAEAWQVPLSVVTVFGSGDIPQETLLRARMYFEDHGVMADYIAEKGAVAPAIFRTAKSRQADFIIMGGYGLNPVLEVVLGSSVDQVLRQSKIPILICR